MNIDTVREYIVIVNGGSGCIFQPADNSYTYILTAKHNVADNINQEINLTRFKFENGSWTEISINNGLLIENNNYFPHPDRDIAIIKVEKISNLENIIRFDDIEEDRTRYILAGYPETRRNANPENKTNWFRHNEDVVILNTNANQLREGEVPNNPGHGEIVGYSGGGIFKISENYILLAGIQNKMVGAADEQMGRIEFSLIKYFNEIINVYQPHLSELHPPYCNSFESLKKKIMKLDGCFENIEYTKEYLQNISDEIIENPLTPAVIKNRLKKRMLVYNEKESSLYNEGLWIAWLEFLIVMKVIGLNPQTEKELDNIFNQYRVIYSSSKEDWGKIIKDITCSDYKGLKENACLIVANETKPDKTIIKKGIIPDVAKSVQKKQMNIDDGVNNPFESFKHIHVHAFQRDCIIDKENEYTNFSNINENDLLQKLKQEYESIFNN